MGSLRRLALILGACTLGVGACSLNPQVDIPSDRSVDASGAGNASGSGGSTYAAAGGAGNGGEVATGGSPTSNALDGSADATVDAAVDAPDE